MSAQRQGRQVAEGCAPWIGHLAAGLSDKSAVRTEIERRATIETAAALRAIAATLLRKAASIERRRTRARLRAIARRIRREARKMEKRA